MTMQWRISDGFLFSTELPTETPTPIAETEVCA